LLKAIAFHTRPQRKLHRTAPGWIVLWPSLKRPSIEKGATMLKHFSADEFVSLFAGIPLPNTIAPAMTAVITGDPQADSRIRALAEELGYNQQSLVAGDLVMVNPTVDDGGLQPLAAASWHLLVAAARRDGLALTFVSGFRSLEIQRGLFVGRLGRLAERRGGRPQTREEIVEGLTDNLVRHVLAGTAPPGYSKHHTGYALDLNDANSDLPFTRFRETAAYRWLSADNFAQAKACGFVPSYPDGQSNLGPRPEPWELVWVGSDRLGFGGR
jgi:hypothetical protein